MEFNWVFSREIKRFVDEHHISHADALASFHLYMERLLVDSINAAVRKHGNRSRNFCFIGGCSLNIKWNSAIRSSGIFDEVFISPFTNDTGSAIGAACCEMYRQTGNLHLKWSVYSGPSAVHNDPPEGWSQKAFSIQELARLLHETNEPVVVLNGRAELGPRALGNRSILATAIQPDMKDRLNVIKQRELYRPVSPICIEERAPLIFEPGTRDPYMLFDHILREPWSELIPAIRHLDGSARLQTVSKDDNPVIYDLLCEYEKLSRIPVLCNTSANLLGSGFFQMYVRLRNGMALAMSGAMVICTTNNFRWRPAPMGEKATYELSHGQKRFWIQSQLNPGSGELNQPMAVRIGRRISPELLRQALKQIVERHFVLRTVFFCL
ncbi:carbamoyltransferase C-terminal domain-containing protein [Paenibacillus rhizoplanae]